MNSNNGLEIPGFQTATDVIMQPSKLILENCSYPWGETYVHNSISGLSTMIASMARSLSAESCRYLLSGVLITLVCRDLKITF